MELIGKRAEPPEPVEVKTVSATFEMGREEAFALWVLLMHVGGSDVEPSGRYYCDSIMRGLELAFEDFQWGSPEYRAHQNRLYVEHISYD